MTDHLPRSLFASTSAFQQTDAPQELPQPREQTTGPSPSENFTKIAALIEEAIWLDIDSPELLDLLEEAHTLARRHA